KFNLQVRAANPTYFQIEQRRDSDYEHASDQYDSQPEADNVLRDSHKRLRLRWIEFSGMAPLGRTRFLRPSLPPPPMAMFADQQKKPRQRHRPGEDGPDRHRGRHVLALA